MKANSIRAGKSRPLPGGGSRGCCSSMNSFSQPGIVKVSQSDEDTRKEEAAGEIAAPSRIVAAMLLFGSRRLLGS